MAATAEIIDVDACIQQFELQFAQPLEPLESLPELMSAHDSVSAPEPELALVLELESEPDPLVFVVPEMEEDLAAREQAERLIRYAGTLAMAGSIERPYIEREPPSRFPTLMHAIHEAAHGDEEARMVVTANVKTDVIERTFKAGSVMKVELETDENNRLMQHGQSMDDVQLNTLLYCTDDELMLPRFQAEVRNNARIENYNRQGVLKDYYFVVMSRAADNMSQAAMAEAGFFIDTMSCSFQATCSDNDKLVTESAFVAGKKTIHAERHDAEAIVRVGKRLNVDLSGKTAAKIIDTPLLVHKSLMPNGVVDLVKMYDEEGEDTFFGQNKPHEDYNLYVEKCKQREAQLMPVVNGIVSQLLADSHLIRTPSQATLRLHELSQQGMVDHSIVDKTIDPRVFGSVAAIHIEQARLCEAAGDTKRLEESRSLAQNTASSSSCPGGKERTEMQDSTSSPNDKEGSDSSTKSEIKRMTCPFCSDDKQYGDPCSPNQYCTSCKATVIDGKVISEGNGGKRELTRRVKRAKLTGRFSAPRNKK